MTHAWTSPDGNHHAEWQWGGEMWMSGPEWGRVRVDDRYELESVLPRALWAADSAHLAFVVLRIDSVPDRKGAEGMSHRVGVLRVADGAVRYAIGNGGLADIVLESFANGMLCVRVDGRPRRIDIRKMEWSNVSGGHPDH